MEIRIQLIVNILAFIWMIFIATTRILSQDTVMVSLLIVPVLLCLDLDYKIYIGKKKK